jgi:RNA polymerase sigma factor for flagellar operon FliA
VKGDEREAIVARLFPAVRAIAHRVARICRISDADDLIGDGALGLVRAVDNYDSRRGVSLECYARHCIVGAMLNGLRRKDPISERARRRVREGERVRTQLEADGTSLSERELEAIVPGFGRARAQVECGLPLSLDAPLPLHVRLRADWSADPARLYELAAQRRDVRGALERLPPRQRAIVFEHYFAERSLKAISEGMAITPQRVSQLHCAALGRLRTVVGTDAR